MQDRFAVARSTPPIDIQQDWILIDSEEEDGYTTLEFTRNYTSCDTNSQDRNITVRLYLIVMLTVSLQTGTSRVVWSFKEEDPSNGVDGTFTRHDQWGSTSVNLLGGLRNATVDPPGTQSFTFSVNQVYSPV